MKKLFFYLSITSLVILSFTACNFPGTSPLESRTNTEIESPIGKSQSTLPSSQLYPTLTSTPTLSHTLFINGMADGSIVTPIIGPDGFPKAEIQIELKGPGDYENFLALEADGLHVGMLEANGSDPFQGILQWTPWHGNGEYVLLIQALNWTTKQELARQEVHVTVSGIPAGTLDVRDKFIQLYKQNFNLDLASPPFTRYIKPIPEIATPTAWASAVYLDDKIFLVNIFDDGTMDARSYDLNVGGEYCRPAGKYSLLVVFVDYGNTGLDPAAGNPSMEKWQTEANHRWAEYSTSVGLAEPILQVDRMETAIISSPPNPGQVVTADQVLSLTGKNPADFDLLAEIDLDVNNTVSAAYGGLGAALSGACNPQGDRQVNITFTVTDENSLTTDILGSTIFGHELTHFFGWSHYWANGTSTNHDLLTKGQFWLPVLLYGWTDTDGDGQVEILDTQTPYGLKP
jgi:hypothetical protein